MTSRGTKYWKSGTIPLIAPDILGDIIAEVADIAVVLSEEGHVLSVLINPETDGLGNVKAWENTPFRDNLTVESAEKFDARLAEFHRDGHQVRPLELNHGTGTGAWEFPIRYTFHTIGPDGAILLLGRDLRAVAEMQQQLVKAQIALERDYEVQREFDTRFRVLMESTGEALVFVSAQSGRITEANGAAAIILGRDRAQLAGRSFAEAFESDGTDLVDQLATHALSDSKMPYRLTHRRTGEVMRIFPTLFRASGERALLVRLETEESAAPALSQLTENLANLFQQGADGMVFTRDNGTILSANDSFLDLIDAAHDMKVRGQSLADFLQRGSVDLKVMIENAARSGRMRLYPTKLTGEFGAPRAVEVAVTALTGGTEKVFAFVIREANRVEASRATNAPVSDENLRSVMELVGSATLKDIVAETTNVVEQMCIETAIELTMNNRVAAAEMLGLSRQSLYVKLRKYGLLNRDDD